MPTKTEQGDLNQAFGASQGDFPRIIIAPLSMADCFTTPALAFNVADRYQCPVIVLSDLLMSEGNETVDPALLDVEFQIDRGELITAAPGGVTARGAPASHTSATRTPSRAFLRGPSRAFPAISTWPGAMSTTRMGC